MGILPRFQDSSRIAKFGLFGIALVFVLCSSLFFHALSPNYSGGQMSAMGCCVADGQAIQNENLMDSMFGKSFVSIGMLSAVFALFFSFFFLLGAAFLQRGINYIRSVRDKYGGFRILNYLQNLFSEGLLHSRDFFVLA